MDIMNVYNYLLLNIRSTMYLNFAFVKQQHDLHVFIQQMLLSKAPIINGHYLQTLTAQ